MNVETYQDEATGLWGYIIYSGKRAVGTSAAIYDNAAEARREGYATLAESDTFF